ncbi:MAG: hypothetical protein ACI959_001751 [Limisphaerales bacterium]|jgi:hypothetical protein
MLRSNSSFLYLMLFVFVVLLGISPSSAQFSASRDLDVPVKDQNGDVIRMPWVGGLNFCNFSNANLNGDTIPDLLVFDKSGRRLLGFKGSFQADTFLFEFEPELSKKYPIPNVFSLIKDYDLDGDGDLFTFRNFGPAVYQNMEEETGTVSFELHNNGRNLPSNNDGLNIVITIPGTDLPALADFDGDGDMDILLFETAGTFAKLHNNLSVELYGHSDSLIFEISDQCWGDFAESGGSRALFIDSCINPFKGDDAHRLSNGVISKGLEKTVHGGSALMVYDADGDGDYEALISDIGYDGITFTRNEGTTLDAHVDTVVYNWPGMPDPVFIDIFPAAFEADADGDGLLDILVSPILQNQSENHNALRWYKNTGTAMLPEFSLARTGYLQNDMLDFGEGSNPMAFDYDSDGDLDLLIGNYGYYTSSGNYRTQLALLENTNPAGPEFTLVDDNYINLPGIVDFTENDASVTSGDIDGDGDIDLIIGENSGTLYLIRNSAGPGALPVWNPEGSGFAGIDAGANAAPELIDVNRDGLLDLLIGERNGNVNYYQNTGSSTSPLFELQTELFGGVNVTNDLGGIGYSKPRLVDFDGKYHLLVGAYAGIVHHYRNIDGNLEGNFEQFDTTYAQHKDGERAGIAFADFDLDGYPDMVVGNYAGGLSYYRGEIANGVNSPSKNVFAITPNPWTDCMQITWSGNSDLQEYMASIYTVTGQKIYYGNASNSLCPADPELILPGNYLLLLENKTGTRYSQMIVKH